MGRFRIVGRIASGGMAEILLAAADGAEGFTRPVVIKRVLPHLARTLEFRTMFIDEARILATLRHPNLVTVEALGEEDEALYLVMEYLDGEGLDGLVKALRRREERMPPALAAYVIAEACAGLHAAHEHRDVQGKPLEIVHRDVSPQNLFVTYAGEVKVIDFGIAQAKDRETKTETGTVKGKFAYMAPEQIEGGEVDRRADVFALGVVLHELLTGQRLYQRNNHLEIVRAICLSPTPRPRTSQPDVPPDLDALVMRALEKSRVDRPASALALREALLGVLDRLGASRESCARELAARMQTLFVEQRSEKTAMLARVMRERTPTHAPSPTVPAPSPRRAIAASVVLAGMLGLGLAAWSLTPTAGEDAATRVEAAPDAPLDEGLGDAGQGDAPTDAGPDGAPSDAGRAIIHLAIASTPSGATVLLDGEAVGETPIEIPIERGTTERRLSLSREGYRPLERLLLPDVDQRLELTLSRIPRGDRPAAPTETPSPFGRVD